MLVAALAEATLVPLLAVNDGHDTDAIDATVVDAGIILLPAAAVTIHLARLPTGAVDARLTFETSATSILSRDSPGHEARKQQRPGGDKGASGTSTRDEDGESVEAHRVHGCNLA